MPATPKRIVSLVPSQTELLVDLGLREHIVGISKFCVHPSELRKQITVVGGTKEVHFDKIRELNPDFIFCNKEENSLEMVRVLETIAPVWISDIYSVADCLEMINLLGNILGVASIASQLITAISTAQEGFQHFMENKSFRRVIYLIWKNPYMAAGRNTFINEMLQLNKFENIIVEMDSRYPEVQEAQLSDADIILLSTEPYPFKEKDAQRLSKEINANAIVVDGEYFSWYGSRLLKAFDYFKSLH